MVMAYGEATTVRLLPCDKEFMEAVALAFFAGILTVAAPCSLPVLPALFGVSLGQRETGLYSSVEIAVLDGHPGAVL
jgi:cytochrome c biogenesis protein CcdA